jgi:hypothetical protein
MREHGTAVDFLLDPGGQHFPRDGGFLASPG